MQLSFQILCGDMSNIGCESSDFQVREVSCRICKHRRYL